MMLLVSHSIFLSILNLDSEMTDTTCSLEFAVGMLLLRMTAGMLFFFQGYDKAFRIPANQVLDTIADPLRKTIVPMAALRPMVLISSWVELLGGLSLVLGLFSTYALYALAADLVIVAFVFSSLNAMWDMRYYFPRFILVAALLFLPAGMDWFSLERLLFCK